MPQFAHALDLLDQLDPTKPENRELTKEQIQENAEWRVKKDAEHLALLRATDPKFKLLSEQEGPVTKSDSKFLQDIMQSFQSKAELHPIQISFLIDKIQALIQDNLQIKDKCDKLVFEMMRANCKPPNFGRVSFYNRGGL